MRPYLLPGLAAVAMLVALASQVCQLPPIEPPERRVPAASPPRSAPPRGGGPPAQPVVRRNPFAYEEAAQPPRAATPSFKPTAAATAVPTPTRPPVKLVGVLQQAQGLRAAISIEGEVTLVAAGQDVDGYSVVSIDVDEGVVLKTPAGEELRLRPATMP